MSECQAILKAELTRQTEDHHELARPVRVDVRHDVAAQHRGKRLEPLVHRRRRPPGGPCILLFL